MSKDSKIEWTHHTANLIWGCSKVHAGCKNCYAETLAKRWGNDVWGKDKHRKEIKSVWNDLLKFQKLAKQANEIHRVFVGSMMDIFEEPKPLIGSFIPEYTSGVLRDRLFDQINEGWYPNLMFLLLTKRPSLINQMIPKDWLINGAPKNVMFGTSPVDQDTAQQLIPKLLRVNGKRFLSIEPQLGPVDLSSWLHWHNEEHQQFHWVINGGESGPHRRHFDLSWAISLRDQCKESGVPYFFKQIDKVRDKKEGIPIELQVREFPSMIL